MKMKRSSEWESWAPHQEGLLEELNTTFILLNPPASKDSKLVTERLTLVFTEIQH